MSFTVEKDWTTKAGLRAVVIATPMGHRCGYVAVPKGISPYGLGYSDPKVEDIEVHGGLTYSGSGEYKYPVKTDEDLWWFGFDCAHLGDRRDASLMSPEYKASWGEYLGEGIIKDTQYVTNECEDLARQLSDIISL